MKTNRGKMDLNSDRTPVFTIILLLPLFTVFYSALEQGNWSIFRCIKEPEALSGCWLTRLKSL